MIVIQAAEETPTWPALHSPQNISFNMLNMEMAARQPQINGTKKVRASSSSVTSSYHRNRETYSNFIDN